MLTGIEGLHHVTLLASGARANNAFFTETLGLRRVKKTVNFDAPEVYHLYFGNRLGSPGTAMTYFPFPNAARGKRGTGEVSETAFSVPVGSLADWSARLEALAVPGAEAGTRFGANTLAFDGPDGERLVLIETEDTRTPWTEGGVPNEMAIRGFHSATLRLADPGPTAELLRFMGYTETGQDGAITRFALSDHNGAGHIDIVATPDAPPATQGAGSVHHIAFAVENAAMQAEIRAALSEAGHRVTPQIDRDYFHAIYFRTPGGVLFEIATNDPGFTRDEPPEHLGQALMLPDQHAHLRDHLEATLEPL